MSKGECDDRLYKDFYLDYALPVRHRKSFPTEQEGGELAVVIDSCDEIQYLSVPVLNLSDEKYYAQNIINAKSIFLSDENIRRYAAGLNVKSGAELYASLGLFPKEKMIVNINKSADLIFFLDM